MFFRYNFFGFCWAAFIFALSIIPGKDLPEVEILDFDTLCHVLFYLVLMMLLVIGFLKQYEYRFFRYHPISIALSGSFVFGVLIEAVQQFFCEGRYFDVKDILANFIGSIFGIIVFKIIYYRYLIN